LNSEYDFETLWPNAANGIEKLLSLWCDTAAVEAMRGENVSEKGGANDKGYALGLILRRKESKKGTLITDENGLCIFCVDFEGMEKAIERYSAAREQFKRAIMLDRTRKIRWKSHKAMEEMIHQEDDPIDDPSSLLENQKENTFDKTTKLTTKRPHTFLQICAVVPHKRPRIFLFDTHHKQCNDVELLTENPTVEAEIPQWWWPFGTLPQRHTSILRSKKRLLKSYLEANDDKFDIHNYTQMWEMRPINGILCGLMDRARLKIPSICRNRHYLFPKSPDDIILADAPMTASVAIDMSVLTMYMFFNERFRQQIALQLTLPPFLSPYSSLPVRVPLEILGNCLLSPAYERLEFLGDAALKLYASTVLVDTVCFLSLGVIYLFIYFFLLFLYFFIIFFPTFLKFFESIVDFFSRFPLLLVKVDYISFDQS
jgi:hypothetical protein